jgi:hypothetical protein
MVDCKLTPTQSIKFIFFTLFTLVFLLLVLLRLDLLLATITPCVVVVQPSPPSRHRLTGGRAPCRSPMAPLTAVDLDKTGLSSS